jgi:hypothetical protein
LFRFATIQADNVTRALDAGLKDILDPATTEIRPSGGRYVAHNRRYDATFGHSGFNETDLPPERALPPILQGLRFLARKLREIVDTGEKILVFRSRHGDDMAEALRLGAALRRAGPNLLLWVAGTETARAPGSVEWIADGVLRGYIEDDSNWDTLRLDTWVSLCEQAHALWRPGVAQPADRRSLAPAAEVRGG